MARTGHAVPRARAARPHRRDPGARVPRRRRAGRALRPRRPRARARARRALPRRAAGRGARRSTRAEARPTRPRSCRSPTATSTSSTASSSTSPREVHDPGYAALLARGCSATSALRAAWRRAPCTRGGHHAYLGGLLEHTVAVGDARARDVHPAPAAERGPADLTAALVHDLGKTREFTYGAEIGLSEEGRLLGHVELGRGCSTSARRPPALDDERRLALAHCVL